MKIDKLKDLVIEAAVSQIAIDDFIFVDGENNDAALSDLKIESTRAYINLLDFMDKEGGMLKEMLKIYQLGNIAEAKKNKLILTPCVGDEIVSLLR